MLKLLWTFLQFSEEKPDYLSNKNSRYDETTMAMIKSIRK